MIVQFTLTPIGTKTDSLSGTLAKAMMLVAKSGLPYKVGPMGTAVEGDWNAVMNLIDRCRKTLLRECDRVSISITVDDRKDARPNRIKEKVLSLEKKMKMKLVK